MVSYFAIRPISSGGTDYVPGDEVDVSGWTTNALLLHLRRGLLFADSAGSSSLVSRRATGIPGLTATGALSVNIPAAAGDVLQVNFSGRANNTAAWSHAVRVLIDEVVIFFVTDTPTAGQPRLSNISRQHVVQAGEIVAGEVSVEITSSASGGTFTWTNSTTEVPSLGVVNLGQ